ncbi:MAG: SRPBCC family protein [Solirubrobacteraceae bacterium]|nr:SRPBCC family protein [Solirubrobacteraceae bacterium]
MAPVDVTIDLDAPPEKVFAFLLDMEQTPAWVTICRAVLDVDPGAPKPGWRCKQRYVLRGAPFVVTWTLEQLRPNQHISWSGRGPARSKASIQEDLSPLPDGATQLRYRNEFSAPGGLLGVAASRALVGDTAEQEAIRSLDRLADLLAAQT